MIKAFLQGKPFGHPIHPALVHFPIGLFILSLLLDIASYLSATSSELSRAAYYAMMFGLVGGALAATAGLADWSDIREDHPAKKTANIHMTLNLAVLGLFAVNLFLRSGELAQERTPLGYLILSAIGVAIILVSGYLGGTMVYDNGVGVGRHRRRTRTPRRTINVSSQKAKDGWVLIADESDLRNGETLRVNCDGNVIAVAKQGGEVYAFQEFCTHRYGPLSEGKLQGHKVQCPWHRSCFDMRNGKVVEGPAKVDLKTYSARIQSGKIFIR